MNDVERFYHAKTVAFLEGATVVLREAKYANLAADAKHQERIEALEGECRALAEEIRQDLLR